MYYMLLSRVVEIFEGWIQGSITKLLDTSSQSRTVNNKVKISELTTEIITKDDKNQEICYFFGWAIKVYLIFTLVKRRLQNG